MPSAVDNGLGLLEQQMLQMVAAVAAFDPSGFDGGEDRSTVRHRPENGSQFLTAIPRFSGTNSPHVI